MIARLLKWFSLHAKLSALETDMRTALHAYEAEVQRLRDHHESICSDVLKFLNDRALLSTPEGQALLARICEDEE